MNSYISDWNFEGDFPINGQKNPAATGADHDLVELLWRNGQVVLQSQTHRKQASNIFAEPSSQVLQNPINEAVSWIQYPIEDSFEREFCSNFFSGSPACDPIDAGSQMPPPRAVNLRVDSSRCGSNQEAKIVPRGESARTEIVEPTVTSSSGGSGSSFGRATTTSGNTNNKRKCGEAELECQSEDAELESKPTYKSAQRSGTSRKSRAAEVHNLSERRRRDRINEKMKALQELIPHSNKTDKASILDEAIEYLKSLQLQVMWMGSGVTPMMFPGVQAHYMPGVGTPSMPSATHLPGRAPNGPVVVGPAPDPYSAAAFVNPLSFQTHPMQSASFAEQYAHFMPMNVFRFTPQQAQYLMAQQLIRNGPSSGGAQINGKNMG